MNKLPAGQDHSSFCIHVNGEQCDVDDLQRIAMPDSTSTYQPVSHFDLAMNIQDAASKILKPEGYEFHQSQVATAKDGQRVFGLFGYRNGGEEMGLSIGWRNSYDRSMAAAVAIGTNVFVCDNLAVSGNICVMHKHTKNVKENLVRSIRNALFDCTATFHEFQEQVARLKDVGLTDDDGARMLGLLAFREILTPTIFNESMREWRKPRFEEFSDRNAWSLYNAVTWGLKQAPIHKTLNMHHDAHGVFVSEFLPPQAA